MTDADRQLLAFIDTTDAGLRISAGEGHFDLPRLWIATVGNALCSDGSCRSSHRRPPTCSEGAANQCEARETVDPIAITAMRYLTDRHGQSAHWRNQWCDFLDQDGDMPAMLSDGLGYFDLELIDCAS
ncbi:hypothetical protein GCM10010873_05410 [Cypionkella aquatica]|uniref:Uncharacterized protein n=1 Tax=Cypionkella aquatica TaxID=1756042 RepID=A0AA37TTF1_9RHOB|nr:hypothetical protein [Cypionkella aquatica]GLS85568.1 hypothetical protein GCM10010873_05410 [Cypionkella aquatica]